MYGAGNEPTTVAQFRQDFPEEMYEYSPECWKRCKELRYRTETRNLFDINALPEYTPETIPAVVAGRYNNSIIGKDRIGDSAIRTSKTLLELCPNIEVGKTYTLSYRTTGTASVANRIYLAGSNEFWFNGRSRTIKDTDLTGVIAVYGNNARGTIVTITEFQIELGSTATPYQPYGYLPLNKGKYIVNKEPANAASFH